MGGIKSGHKAGIHLQISQELIDPKNEGARLVSVIKEGFEKERRRLLIKKSIRVLNWTMKHGHNGDDFVRNMYTVVFTGKGYKVPRIVKRLFK